LNEQVVDYLKCFARVWKSSPCMPVLLP